MSTNEKVCARQTTGMESTEILLCLSEGNLLVLNRRESIFFKNTKSICPSYEGNGWSFFKLSNGGFFLAPKEKEPRDIQSKNGFQAKLSSEATGILGSLFALQEIAKETSDGTEGERFAQLCQHLLEYIDLHPESELIKKAFN